MVWGASAAGVDWTPGRVGVAALAVLCCGAVVVAVLAHSGAGRSHPLHGGGPPSCQAFTYGGGRPERQPAPDLRVGAALRLPLGVPFGLAVTLPALHVLERDRPAGRPGLAPGGHARWRPPPSPRSPGSAWRKRPPPTTPARLGADAFSTRSLRSLRSDEFKRRGGGLLGPADRRSRISRPSSGGRASHTPPGVAERSRPRG